MEFDLDINLFHSPKIVQTPLLKQFLKVLKMGYLELIEYIDDRVQENPALEFAENDGYTTEMYTDMEDSDNTSEDSVASMDSSSDDSEKERPGDSMTLKDYLLLQLNSTNLNYTQKLIGEYLIDNTDENGYITSDITNVANFFNIPTDGVLRILKRLQSFDPPGICARNLKECLLIQLNQMKDIDNYIKEIVNNYLEDLASDDIYYVARCTGLLPQKIEEIRIFIKYLEPKPGREFGKNTGLNYIIPDIIVKRIKEKNEVIYNEVYLPIIGIGEFYEKALDEDIDYEARKFILDRIVSAKWFLKCMDYRKDIITKVAAYLVERQQEFMEKGGKFLCKLDKSSAAADLGLDETMLYYALANKFIQCQWGVFDMGSFWETKDDSKYTRNNS